MASIGNPVIKMTQKKNIFVIIGSASQNSTNEKLVENFEKLTHEYFNLKILKDLKTFPHFDPNLSVENTPKQIVEFRKEIENADGILICTPEYVFSIPSGLKNLIEWSVSTTIFSNKPTGIITASANGEKGHDELKLIMKTLMALFTDETTLLIPGIKGKINDKDQIIDKITIKNLAEFIKAFKKLINNASH